MASADTTRLAVLIDADNASASVAKELLEDVAKHGTATAKRAYGDCSLPARPAEIDPVQSRSAAISRPYRGRSI